jgi:hypothetical protein
MKKFVGLLFVLCLEACASASSLNVQSPQESREFAALKNGQIGDKLAERGHYLEATFYYEAALILSTDETQILPKLIATQVRADRLRAARLNTERLVALVGLKSELSQLLTLLDTYAPLYAADAKEIQESLP